MTFDPPPYLRDPDPAPRGPDAAPEQEVTYLRDRLDRTERERDEALAKVAAVEALAERWDQWSRDYQSGPDDPGWWSNDIRDALRGGHE